MPIPTSSLRNAGYSAGILALGSVLTPDLSFPFLEDNENQAPPAFIFMHLVEKEPKQLLKDHRVNLRGLTEIGKHWCYFTLGESPQPILSLKNVSLNICRYPQPF